MTDDVTEVLRPGSSSIASLQPPDGIRAASYEAARVVGIATYGSRAVALFSLFVVSRFLTPLDFGVAAIALLVGGILVTVSDFGLSSTLVSYGELASPATFRRATRYRLIFSLVSFAIIFVAAGPLSVLLGAPEAEAAIRVVSFVLLMAAAAFSPLTGLASRRNFDALAWANFALSITQAAVTIVLAILLRSYWAIVVGLLAGVAAQTLVMWLRWTDRSWSGSEDVDARTLLSVGGLVTLSWVSVAILFAVDRIIISSQFGPQQLGYYALALSWALFISGSLNVIVGTVALPTFARIGRDSARVGAAYLAATRLITFIAAPASIGLVFIAPELLVLILGGGSPKWLPSIQVLQILAFVGLLQCVVGPATSVLLATKSYAKHAYLIPVPVAVFLVLAIPMANLFGSIEGVAVALVVAYGAAAGTILRAVTIVTGIERWSVLRNIAGPVGGAALMAAILLPIRLLTPIAWQSLVAIILVGIVGYVGGILVIGRKTDLDEFLRVGRAMFYRGSRES